MTLRIIRLFLFLSIQANLTQGSTALKLFTDLTTRHIDNHLPYVNPQAPKGGQLIMGVMGQFTTINPASSVGIMPLGQDLIFESLLKRVLDEPFALYPRVAQTVDRTPTTITFHLNPKARFSDNTPLTAHHVAQSYNHLSKHGPIGLRPYYGRYQDNMRVDDDRTIHFTFDENDRFFPLFIGFMPIFKQTNTNPHSLPIGSGPYALKSYEMGRSLTFARQPTYWGARLPINVGHYNFDTIKFVYFHDTQLAFEALKSQKITFWPEPTIHRWKSLYTFPAVKNGTIIQKTLPLTRPAGMRGLGFNTRRPVFANATIRQALSLLFDFDWINRTFFHNQYKRTHSYFENSLLAARGLPTADEETLMKQLNLPEIYFSSLSTMPYKGRQTHKHVQTLLTNAGLTVNKKGKWMHQNQPLKFECLLTHGPYVKIIESYIKKLQDFGIDARIRLLEASSYHKRLKNFDFDMILHHWTQSDAPGSELKRTFAINYAQQKGSTNFCGISDPVIDQLLNKIISAPTLKYYQRHIRVLDRLLQHNNYVIPLFHPANDYIAHHKSLRFPPTVPVSGFPVSYWWCVHTGWSAP
jgi:ABC-type oligopeptide transport system substrate-binding subunit